MALTTSISSLDQKMAEISKFMQKEIRYVAIELGIGGWQPHSAADVFSTDMEIAKTKRPLMSSMLKQAGIESYYVVINTRRGAVGPDTPPMIYLFNHVILAIKLPDGAAMARYEAVFEDPRLGRLLIFRRRRE